jgi:hypothetical protein
LVGVYEDCSGKTGNFFMILDQPVVGHFKVHFLSSVPTQQPFPALRKDHTTIMVGPCLDYGYPRTDIVG